MPAPTTIPEFIDLVRKSQLVEPAKLDGYLTTHPGPFESPAALSRRMQADGLITPFHSEQILRGKYRGFFLGKYKVLDRIGLGGMGQVFLAEHTNMRRRAALKVLPPDRAENQFSKERFLREARAAAQLDHPNLVRAFDVDFDGDVIFLVMEFVDGINFHDLVVRHGPLTPARAGYFIWQSAMGLEYMSSRGLIHRDIKPANLLVDRNGVVKILDLGLVRSEEENDELTRGEGVKILGTADYLAPEQAIDCSRVDVRADIYSLGATAYFLLTGQPPFGGDKIAHKLIAHQTRKAVPVHELRPEIPVELSAVVTKMLAKKPAERYQTPAEVMAALDEWAVNPPPPPSDIEIPSTTGGGGGCASSAVSLGTNTVRPSRGGSSAAGLSTSGSAIKYHSARFAATATAAGPVADATPIPLGPLYIAAAGPVPAPPKPFHLPSLPAGTTHGMKKGTSSIDLATAAALARKIATKTQPAIPRPEPVLVRPAGSLRHRASMALAFSLTLALGAWDVAVLTGTLPRSIVPNFAGLAEPAANSGTR